MNANIEPAYISYSEAMRYTNESKTQVKERLREGTYKAKKSGRRTLIEFASVKAYLAGLPDAKFAKPKRRKAKTAPAAAVGAV